MWRDGGPGRHDRRVVNSTDTQYAEPPADYPPPNGTVFADMLGYTRTVINSSVDKLTITVSDVHAMDSAATKITGIQGIFNIAGTGTLYTAPDDVDDVNLNDYEYDPAWCGYTDWSSRTVNNANLWSYVNIPLQADSTGGILWTHSSTQLVGTWSAGE